MLNELKPCPFCGCYTHLQKLVNYKNTHTTYYQARCNNFFCEIQQKPEATKENVIKKWNIRKLCVYDEREKSTDLCEGYYADKEKTKLNSWCNYCDAFKAKESADNAK